MKSHDKGLPEEVPTLASVFQEAGYDSWAVVTTRHFAKRFGFNRGFDKYRLFRATYENKPDRSAPRQVDRVLRWLDSRDDEPFFLFFHTYDAHSDYDPSPAFRDMFAGPYDGKIDGTTKQLLLYRQGKLDITEADRRHLVDLYDAGIRELDDDLTRLIDYLEAEDLLDNTYIILTSDHGEEFLEHGNVLHGRTMYEEVLRVPLIVRGPGIPAGKRSAGLVQLTDIFPTILSLAGLGAGLEVDGTDLSPDWQEQSLPDLSRFAFAEADHNGVEDDIKRMVRRGPIKLVYDRLTEDYELFDLAADRAEINDVSEEREESAQILLAELHRYMAAEKAGVEISPLSEEDRERLKSLGYLQ
jgi:arylsulfatase A-like enzyme